jgi:DNA-binding transcriptional LysR family regulator
MQWSDRIGRRIKLRDLHILTEVVQAGSMSKAARNLAISTPVVSKTITELEHTIGVSLLDRSATGVEATIYGRALLRWSGAAFDDLRQGLKEIEFLADPTAGELRIGCGGAIVEGILPVILNRLRRRHPRLNLNVTQANTAAVLYRELRERNIDLILGRIMMSAEDDLSTQALFDDPLLVVAGNRNPWRRRRSIELQELIDEPWILPRPGIVASVIAETFAACGLRVPRADAIIGSIHLHNALLADGRSLAFLPSSVLRFGAVQLSMKPLHVKLPDLPRPVGVITLRGRLITPAAQLFIECAREVAKPLAKGK